MFFGPDVFGTFYNEEETLRRILVRTIRFNLDDLFWFRFLHFPRLPFHRFCANYRATCETTIRGSTSQTAAAAAGRWNVHVCNAHPHARPRTVPGQNGWKAKRFRNSLVTQSIIFLYNFFSFFSFIFFLFIIFYYDIIYLFIYLFIDWLIDVLVLFSCQFIFVNTQFLPRDYFLIENTVLQVQSAIISNQQTILVWASFPPHVCARLGSPRSTSWTANASSK